MDLVEIAANATPPVVRIVDFKKSLWTKKSKASRLTTATTRKEFSNSGSRRFAIRRRNYELNGNEARSLNADKRIGFRDTAKPPSASA